MNPFFKNNISVIEVEVEEFMSSTIKSLTHLKIIDESLVDIIVFERAPSTEKSLNCMVMAREEMDVQRWQLFRGGQLLSYTLLTLTAMA
mmetsp:Transcript_40941/g.73818  ORF Transcript_40941/g.73818 Transcript_40941/m.73818 type:complete len:89 (+) Transcript_40941:553-819(+)|eukprot:CAMPEP_0201914742 /NCGR_PEP_ID=MMETSP0903-20130614/4849_1 /ASSEMBLY_ACC=CAM_ASM_000552 /TAXON_ID=420261 /ORGANISM="Thalassiosira antarctica, Strain CCMP982" /LENGTH=88 /DNA_ID=CAMNT_0048450189 /DNA_START=546 /DNA_END=812 /DNA_ORIENTATION=-